MGRLDGHIQLLRKPIVAAETVAPTAAPANHLGTGVFRRHELRIAVDMARTKTTSRALPAHADSVPRRTPDQANQPAMPHHTGMRNRSSGPARRLASEGVCVYDMFQ